MSSSKTNSCDYVFTQGTESSHLQNALGLNFSNKIVSKFCDFEFPAGSESAQDNKSV